MTFLALRFAIASALLGVWAAWRGEFAGGARDVKGAVIVGALIHGVYLGGVFTAISLGAGAAVSALIVGLAAAVVERRGGMLISLLILPLYMPVLIFGSAAVSAAAAGTSAAPFLALLGAMLSLAVALAPLAIGAGLRISVDA